MDQDENIDISAKTRARAAESILKSGYMNGAAEGQTNSYQDSFDKGYEDGFKFGYQIGFYDALNCDNSSKSGNLNEVHQHLNCQICNKKLLLQQDIRTIIKEQNLSNDTYLMNIGNNKTI